jgi:hypothetical protein
VVVVVVGVEGVVVCGSGSRGISERNGIVRIVHGSSVRSHSRSSESSGSNGRSSESSAHGGSCALLAELIATSSAPF